MPPPKRRESILDRCRKHAGKVPILLGLVRILICFWSQTGYMHPDEFFQSADIVAGRQLNSKIYPVWEFTTDKPIRCMLLPSLLNTIAFKLAKFLQSQPSAYLLLVTPRLIYTLASFSIDHSLLKLCQYYSTKGLPYLPISVIFQTSFICLGIFTRTLSNTTEAIIFGWLLVLVCRTVRPSFRILFVTQKLSKPIHQRISKSAQITSSLLLGSLVTLGIFNRPTFPCFALIPCTYWLLESFKRNHHSMRLTIQRAMVPLVISGFLTFALLSCYDTIYYSGNNEIVSETFRHLLHANYDKFYHSLKTNWIVTPYNFLVFNTNTQNTSKYGHHGRYTHLLVNLPLAFNILAVVFYRKLVTQATSSGLRRILDTHRIQVMLLLSSITSVLMLSLIPHQEFRFLAPLIIPLVYTCASDIYQNKRLLSGWLIFNIILVYFYARVHQSGVTNAMLDLDQTLKQQKATNENNLLVNLVASKCYPIPTYAWNIGRDDDRFHFNLGDTITDDFWGNMGKKLEPVLQQVYADANSTIEHQLHAMLPRLYVGRFVDLLGDQPNLEATIVSVRNYSSHFGGEEFGESINHIKSHGISSWREAFGFSLMQIKLTVSNDQGSELEEELS